MKVTTERRHFATPGEVAEQVSAVVHRPTRAKRPAFLLVHGAGGDLDDAGLVALCDAIASHGHLAVRANLPYREAGRRTPPRADRAVAGFTALARDVRELAPRTPWVLGGKSYGGRVASMAVAAGLEATGMLFYGYPLHPPGKPEKLRVDHLPAIDVPCLFVSGTRDAFGTPEELTAWTATVGAPVEHVWVDGAGHDLRRADATIADAVARFVADVTTA